MTVQQLQGHKILFTAPILAKTQGEVATSYGTMRTGPVDAIDLNGNGKLDSHYQGSVIPWGKGDVTAVPGVEAEEPVLYSPTMQQLQQLGARTQTDVITAQDLPEGIYIADAFGRSGGQGAHQQEGGTRNIRPLQTLVYQQLPELNPKATWAIDLNGSRLVIFEKE